MSRCLYNSSFAEFINTSENSIFGALCERYHGEALTTTREAWRSEISIKADVRSSNYLEDAATEIQVQGLELDYTCLLWDADMRYEDGKWRFYRFNGQTKWVEQIGNTESKQKLMKYMLNAYRVLLTRARAGMVICVPEGNANKTVSGF